MTSPHLAYRPEIDGLRMIAVLAVVLYHFGLPGLGGGFAGVDVFFVISGYLIGGILWREVGETGKISLARFYVRRIKRLAPAFFTMALVVSLAAWFVLLPFEFREYGKSLIAATVYLSNVLFYRGEGYFDIGADNKVLLHTWSLSVEEQFYLFLPLFILLLARWPKLLVAALWALFALSLAACIWATPAHQTATFYLFPFRAWELLAGVLLAIHQPRLAPRAWLSWLGLGLVLFSLAAINAETGFPGWQALAPVFGTALLLANGQDDNAVNRALSTPPSVFIGKISYSLYLWHWPVFVLSSYWRDGYSGWPEAALWIALSLVLATLSWRFVETPIRTKSGWRLPPVLLALCVPSVAALAFGALAYVKDGLPQRFNEATQAHIAASADFLQDWSRCTTPERGAFQGVELCPIGPEGPPRVLIWGDSHLRAVKEGLEQAAWQSETPALIIWHAGCPPLFGVSKTESYATQAEDEACTTAKQVIAASLPSLEAVQSVLLVGRWSYYASGRGIGLDEDNTIALQGYEKSSNAEVLRAGFAATLPRLEALFGRVFVLQQTPELPSYNSREAAKQLAHGRATKAQISANASASREAVEARQAPANRAMSGANMIGTWDWFCTDAACSALADGQSLYFDNNHITNTAARRISNAFAPVFKAGNAP